MSKKHWVDLVCYCFEYTRQSIKQDLIGHGFSAIMEKIAGENKMGACECATQNPAGR